MPAPRETSVRESKTQMAGYPRVIGYVAGARAPGTGVYGDYVVGADPTTGAPIVVHPQAPPSIHSPPWRPMIAPGSPPVGEGHVPMPLVAETFGGVWGAAGAAAGVMIQFSARPQKPFKMTRILARSTILSNANGTANGTPLGQIFVGTDLQQAELGYIDLATIGAGGSFDTWVSMKQAEPGVWIRFQVTLTAYPTAPDALSVNLTGIGHYLH